MAIEHQVTMGGATEPTEFVFINCHQLIFSWAVAGVGKDIGGWAAVPSGTSHRCHSHGSSPSRWSKRLKTLCHPRFPGSDIVLRSARQQPIPALASSSSAISVPVAIRARNLSGTFGDDTDCYKLPEGGHVNAVKSDNPELRSSLLIVEDEPISRAVAADYFRSLNYDVFEASTAVEGAEILRAVERVDIVFADINLPGVMGGLSFAVWLAERYPEIPIVLTSGVQVIGPKLAGRVPFVPKPYSLEEVGRLFDGILKDDSKKP
jgi:two-component system, response regulator PdtaR